MEKKLIEFFKEFSLMDLLGFGHLLEVEETEEFEDFLTNIVAHFSTLKRKEKKQFYHLAKNIAEGKEHFDLEMREPDSSGARIVRGDKEVV